MSLRLWHKMVFVSIVVCLFLWWVYRSLDAQFGAPSAIDPDELSRVVQLVLEEAPGRNLSEVQVDEVSCEGVDSFDSRSSARRTWTLGDVDLDQALAVLRASAESVGYEPSVDDHELGIDDDWEMFTRADGGQPWLLYLAPSASGEELEVVVFDTCS